jgi:uncharacterized lipoprotein YmbA
VDGAQVLVYPGNAEIAPDCQVSIALQRFDSILGESVTVEVMWTVRLTARGESRSGRSAVREATGGQGYDALVAAHNRALAAVSKDIAAAVRAVRAKP